MTSVIGFFISPRRGAPLNRLRRPLEYKSCSGEGTEDAAALPRVLTFKVGGDWKARLLLHPRYGGESSKGGLEVLDDLRRRCPFLIYVKRSCVPYRCLMLRDIFPAHVS